ncbi:MAG: hypothetical protein ABT01_04740 [Clostridium sp. SCN 57-10]|nr:MAG: hypothetical protein ABT01_04740 [Clostridium sp. SCN 57-10]
MLTDKTGDISGFLKTTHIFQNVPLAALEEAAVRCVISHPRRGAILYRKGNSAKFMYFLRQGYVMESVNYRESVDVIVKVKCPGDYFGETAIMTDMEYQNTAIVTEDANLILMPKETFLRLAQSNYSVCSVVIRELVERLTNSAQNMVNSMYLDAPGRLAFTILNLTGVADKRHIREIRVTQGALAASSGMARQTAAKVLSEWRRDGWIATDRGKLCVLDVDRLLNIILNSELRC